MSTADQSSTLPPEDVEVAHFREILIWPLAIDAHLESAPAGGGRGGAKRIAKIVRVEAERLRKAGPWKTVDPLYHVPKEVGEPIAPSDGKRQEPYAEYVYFHDFVQRFFYPRNERADGKQSEARGFHLLGRSDITAVDVEITSESELEIEGGKKFRKSRNLYRLDVDRCNLYLFPTGVAVLALEVSTQECLRISDVLRIQDTLRRAYTPYFAWFDSMDEAEHVKGYRPCDIPAQVTWLDDEGKPLGATIEPLSLIRQIENIEKRREPPVLCHWRELIAGLTLKADNADATSGGIRWRHVVDDRIPFMSYVRIKNRDGISDGANLERIPRGDLMRLCFADPPGQVPGECMYDWRFMENFESEHCYDRFRHSGTRHLFAGYAYVAVGAGSFFENIIVHHFRHMYFQMALIAHMEFAACLAFSSRITQAVAESDVTSRQFRDRLMHIQEEFLEFFHRFRFTGVSNQMQAKEMFDRWCTHLRLDEIFKDVKDELQSATSYLFARESREQTEAATRLNVIAVVAVVLGLAFGFLGMNVMWDGSTVQSLIDLLSGAKPEERAAKISTFRSGITSGLVVLGTVVSTVSFIALLAARRLFPRTESDSEASRKIRLFLYVLLAGGLAVSALALTSSALVVGLP